MNLDELPKPSDLASVLGHSELGAFRPTLAVLADNRPHLIALSRHDIERWRSITQTIKRIPYYGRTMLLCQIKDISHSPAFLTLLWDRVKSNWTEHQRQQPCTLKPYIPNERIETMITRPTATAPTIPTPADLQKQLKPTFKGQDGETRHIGYLPLTVANALALLAMNVHNRRPNWRHIETLISNWRTDWIPETSLLTVSFKKMLEDGQHRLIALVLAFGTQAEVAYLLIMMNSWTNSRFRFKEGTKDDEVYGDPVKFVPIKGYNLNRNNVPDFDRWLPVQMDANPRVGEKADSDQRKRTGAEMLGKNEDIADSCSRWGVSEETMQTIIRTIYLRCLPPTEEAKTKDGATYGTIRKGGNVQPARYIALFRVFGPYIGEALQMLADSNEWSATDSVIPIHYLVANLALALQGKVPEKQIHAFLDQWAGVDPVRDDAGEIVVDANGNGTFYPVAKTGAAKVAEKMKEEKDRRLTSLILCYLPSRMMQTKEGNLPCNTPNQLLAIMGEGLKDEKGKAISIEQQQANRLPGYDTNGCKEILTASLVKKLKAEQNKTERKKQKA